MKRPGLSRSRGLAEVAALAAVLTGGFFLIAAARDPQRQMRPDEPLWISAGAQAFQLLADGAGPARWEREPVASGLASFGNPNPPVAKYWIGAFALALRGPEDTLDYAWDPADGPRESAARGRLPGRDLVLGVRTSIAVLGAGCLVLVYGVARLVTGARGLSLLAPLALLSTPAFAEHATLAYTDVPQLFLLLVGVAAWLQALRRGGIAWPALAAAALGLACAAKYSSAPALIGALLFTALRRIPWRQRLRDAGLLAAGAVAAFWISTPYLYTHPVQKQLAIVDEWSRIKEVQRQEPALRRQAVESPARGLVLAARRGLLRPAHPALPVASAALGPLNAWGILSLLGAAALAAGRGHRPLGRSAAARCEAGRALLLLIATTWLVTGLWLPLDWSRYYLPILVLTPPLLPAALVAGLRWLGARR